MTKTIDTSRPVEIKGSPGKLIGLLLLAIVLTAISVYLVQYPPEGQENASGLALFLCIVGIAIVLWRLLFVRGPIVTLSREGIRDIRVAAELIPWSAILKLSTWQHKDQKMMVLAIDPAVQKGLKLSLIARWTRHINRVVGADGLCITANGLELDFDTLLKLSTAFAEAAKQNHQLATAKP